jgi:hypothetical protein
MSKDKITNNEYGQPEVASYHIAHEGSADGEIDVDAYVIDYCPPEEGVLGADLVVLVPSASRVISKYVWTNPGENKLTHEQAIALALAEYRGLYPATSGDELEDLADYFPPTPDQ